MRIRIKNPKSSLVIVELTGTTASLARGQEKDVIVEIDANKVLVGPADLMAKIKTGEIEVADWRGVADPSKAQPKAPDSKPSDQAPATENPATEKKKTGPKSKPTDQAPATEAPAASPMTGVGIPQDDPK